jgi:hypothetical protein
LSILFFILLISYFVLIHFIEDFFVFQFSPLITIAHICFFISVLVLLISYFVFIHFI